MIWPLLFDTSFGRVAEGGRLRHGGGPGLAAARVLAETAGAPPHGVPAIEMATEVYAQARAGAAAALFRALQHDAVEPDGVVQRDHAFLLVAEDLLEIGPAQRDKGRGGVGGRAAKFGVEGRQKALVAVMHHVLVVIYAILRDHLPYRELAACWRKGGQSLLW